MDHDEVSQTVRTQRPEDGWSRSPEGRALMERTLRALDDGVKPATRPSRRVALRAAVAAGAATGVAVLALGISGVLSTGPDPVPIANGRTVTMESSYVIDVSSLPAVLAYTDTVFVGRVEEIEGQDAEEGWTYARVRVVERIEGTSPSVVMVRQRGYVDDAGTTHVSEGQALVGVGRAYVFAVSDEPDSDQYTAIAGPHGAVDAGGNVETLLHAYRAALP